MTRLIAGEDYAGLIFGVTSVTYMLAGIFVGNIISRYPTSRKHLILTGLMLTGVANIFLGPAPAILGFVHEHLATVITMMAVLGVGYAMICIPVMPEFMSHLEIIYPHFMSKLNGDIASSL